MVAAPVLYTVGYEGRTLDDVVALLQEHKVTVLLDVREVAWSHKRDFARKALADGLAAAGIEYVHAAFAGNPKALRKSGASLSRILQGYARHLDATAATEEQFDALVSGFQRKRRRVALLCFERDPAECHRGVLAARWQERRHGNVVHLGTEQLRLGAL